MLKFFPVENDGSLKGLIPSNDQLAKTSKGSIFGFINFLRETLDILTKQLHPDATFELLYPAIELIKAIFQTFGIYEFSPKRNITYQPIGILHFMGAFNSYTFQFLLSMLRISWESVRLQAFEILLAFPNKGDYKDEGYVRNFLLPEGLNLTKK